MPAASVNRWRASLALSALTIFVYLLPFLFTRVPLGFLYLSTDVPLHVAGVQREICHPCYARDTLFVGDTRTLSELHAIYPAMAWLSRVTTLGPVTVSALWGLCITLAAVLGAYWALRRLGCGELLSAACSAVLLFGVQTFGGVFVGGLGGGYNTHTMAISIALVLFGAFAVMVSGSATRVRSLWLIPVTAACMNIYPLVFPHLIILMTVYHLAFRTVPIRKLALALASCLLLVPVPILEFLRIRSLPVSAHLPDLRQVMPYMYVENWQYFVASSRRFIMPLLMLAAAAFASRKKPSEATVPGRQVLLRTASISAIFLVISIGLEQVNASFIRYQFSPAMSEWLFLSLFYLTVMCLQAWPIGSIPRRVAMVIGWAVMIVFVSSAVFVLQGYRGWIKNASILRDRADLLSHIHTLGPADALFLSDPNRMALEIRGFAGRGVVVAEKDRGKAQIDSAQFHDFSTLYAAVRALDFARDISQLKAIALMRQADYVILERSEVSLDKEDVVYRNGSFAVIRP